jgi:mannose-6-phosphate isomerase-like protein (cupin superfamily)
MYAECVTNYDNYPGKSIVPLTPTFVSADGTLHSWEFVENIALDVVRIYFIDMLHSDTRGFHAHKNLSQVFIVIDGEISISLTSGTPMVTSKILLKSGQAIQIGAMTWREFTCISSSARICVAANHVYQESDYIRDFVQFQGLAQHEF